MAKRNASTKSSGVKRFFSLFGPGLITGAADDDPSGVATYTITGAQLGTSLLWTALITWPLMGCVQFMCVRIGMVTGLGLAGALRQKAPRWILIVATLALFAANSINNGHQWRAGAVLTGWHSDRGIGSQTYAKPTQFAVVACSGWTHDACYVWRCGSDVYFVKPSIPRFVLN